MPARCSHGSKNPSKITGAYSPASVQDAVNNIQTEQSQIEALQDQIVNGMPEGSSTLEGGPVHPDTAAQQAANLLRRAAAEGEADNLARFARVREEINNIPREVRTASWMLSASESLTKWFLRGKQATLEKWALLTTPSEGKTTSANETVSLIRGRKDKFIGSVEYMNREFFAPWIKSLKVASERLGFKDVEDFAQRVGMYATLRHMPERTDYLINQVYPAAMQEVLRNPDLSETERLRNYNQLEEDLNEIIEGRDQVGINPATGRRWLSGGRTDAEAAADIDAFFNEYHISREEMDTYADGLVDVYQQIQRWRAENGFMESSVAEDLPPFEYFVPVRTIADLHNPPGGYEDAAIYNPGSLHAMKGTRGDIAEAFTTIRRFMVRAGQEYANRDLGQRLVAIRQRDGNNGLVRAYPYGNGRGSKAAADALAGKTGFVMTVAIPERLKDGTVRYQKYAITFDPTKTDADTGISGRALNDAMRDMTEADAGLGMLGRVNNRLASLNTYYSPLFSVVNAPRDFGERISAMFGQSYRLENGNIVDGTRFVRGMISAIPEVTAFLKNVMRGTVDLDASEIGRIYKDYVTDGLRQEFIAPREQTNKDLQSLQNMVDDIAGLQEYKTLTQDKSMQGVRNALAGLGQGKLRLLAKGLHNWNEFFNNIAPLSQYYTLRRMGVTRESARDGTTSIMNLREQGTLTNLMRAIFPFAKPTLQGGASMLRTMGLAPNAAGEFRPNIKGIGYMLGTVMAMAALKPVIAGAFGEENLDAMPIHELSRYIPIKFSNDPQDVFKMPLPFGPTQVSMAFFHAVDRMLRGKLEPSEAAGETLAALIRNVQPADLPMFSMKTDPAKFLLEMFVPNMVMPLYRVAANTNAFGQPITYADKKSITPMSEQGTIRTATAWHTLARTMSPIIDATPESWKEFATGYLSGPLRMITGTMEQQSAVNLGFDKSTQGILGPVFTALGMTMLYKRMPDATSMRFYEAYNDTIDKLKSYSVITTDGQRRSAEDREAFIRERMDEKGVPAELADRYFQLYKIDQELRKLSTKLRTDLLDSRVWDSTTSETWRSIYDTYLDNRRDLQRAGLGE